MNVFQRLYGCLTAAERKFFEVLGFLCYRPKAKVISVGNLSVGGTGKTPVLFELIKELKNKKICVLTRGYKSKYERGFYMLKGKTSDLSDFTDETRMLNSMFSDVPVFIGKNRHHSAIMADIAYKPEIMLVDDGFQYRRIKKDIEIVLLDAMAEAQEAFLLPVGRFRESPHRLAKADVVLLTRCESASSDKISFWRAFSRRYAPKVPVIEIKTVCTGVYDGDNLKINPTGQKMLAFCAIGRPNSFYAQLRALGIKIIETREFSDHHVFELRELTSLADSALKCGAGLICTEKDYCKIPIEFAKNHNISRLKIAAVPASGKSFLSELAFLMP